MIFLLTTGSIMAISIFLIYRLCRFFHIDMKYSSLLLCAVLAFVVNGAAIIMSPFLDKAHYLRLGLLVVVAAALVTFYNERLLRREEAAAKTEPVIDEPDEVLAASPAVTANPSSEQTVTTDATASKLNQKQTIDSNPKTAITAESKPAAEQISAPKATNETVTEDKTQFMPAESSVTPVTAKADMADKLISVVSEPMAAKVPVTMKADTADTLPENKAAVVEPISIAATAKDTVTLTTAIESYAAAVAKLENLDDLLDYAYDHQASLPQAAICAYKRAIEQYPNDDYMPFLIIELGNLYKNQADYHSTISIYAKALKMPVIAQNDATRQEFVKNLRYLGIVQDILSKHNALSTPFAEIPAAIMQEIEQVFQKRLAESS